MTATTDRPMGIEVTLEPCPFCGGEAVGPDYDDEFEAWRCGCSVCNGHTWADTEAAAITAWNTRQSSIASLTGDVGMLVDQSWLDRRQAEPAAEVEAGAPIRQHIMPGDPPGLGTIALQWYLKFDFGYPHSVRESNIAVESFKDGHRAALTPSPLTDAPDAVREAYRLLAVNEGWNHQLASAYGHKEYLRQRIEGIDRLAAGTVASGYDAAGYLRDGLSPQSDEGEERHG